MGINVKEVIEKYCTECKSGNIEKIDYTEEVTGDFWGEDDYMEKAFRLYKNKKLKPKKIKELRKNITSHRLI